MAKKKLDQKVDKEVAPEAKPVAAKVEDEKIVILPYTGGIDMTVRASSFKREK